MSMWSRISGVFRINQVSDDIDEELESHVEEAVARGRDPDEARRALGSALRLREQSRDLRLNAWLNSLRSDAGFGWRQLAKNKIRPAVGRLFTAQDDTTPGAHPYAVLSYDYWARRFGRDPAVVGRTLRIDNAVYEVIGVSQAPFTGTEPGMATDIFVPAMMYPVVRRSDVSWMRMLVQLRPGASVAPIEDRIRVPFRANQENRAKTFGDLPKERLANFMRETVSLLPASSGISTLQQGYRTSLWALGLLVAIVLMIACANVANLMTAQAAARAREMALRVSIGAGRWRLVQLVLVESAWIAGLATLAGALFAWWSAPLVVGMINPADNPARVALPIDWRVVGFGLVLAVAVAGMFGLTPALRASAVKPSDALRGGGDLPSRRRIMHALVTLQVTFCVLVLFVTGLLVVSFERLRNQPTGFSDDRLLVLDAVAQPAQPPPVWQQVADHLRSVPGVEAVATSGWALFDGNGWNGFVSVSGEKPKPVLAYFLGVSPGWMDTMRIPFVSGRDFRDTDTQPGSAMVNELFVKEFLGGENPIGRSFDKPQDGGVRLRYEIIGVVKDARYRTMREVMLPTVYVPLTSLDAKGRLRANATASLIVRTENADPLTLASVLRHEVGRARPEFRVSTLRTQTDLNQARRVMKGPGPSLPPDGH